MSPDTPIEILLVEDNPGDVRLIEEAFEATETETRLYTASDGYDALHFLKRRATADSKSLPHLALVDLNLPGKDGCELLEAIRNDPQLRWLPVLILTSSDATTDIVRCYEATANAYLTKPARHDEFIDLIRSIERFWYEQAHLPPVTE